MTGGCSVEVTAGAVRLRVGSREAMLHPHWLRDHTREPSQVEATSRQRLFTPQDIPPDLAALDAAVEPGSGEPQSGELTVGFSDGHRARFGLDWLARVLGWVPDPEEPPAPEPWVGAVEPFPHVDWAGIGWSREGQDHRSVLDLLQRFYRHGFVVVRGTPTEPGTVARVAGRLGYLVPTNFGPVFDVRSEARPTDLAYTAIALVAHTDLPYRRPVPGIQLLHCLANEAPGGDSTLVDGLAAARAIEAHDPDLHLALTATEVEYRYDIGTDTVVGRGRTIGLDADGRFAQVRLNPKLDSPVVTGAAAEPAALDRYYRARRWFVDWVDDPAHALRFRLEPGDVMIMDNHRVLHGRTAFDPAGGRRHLQGCYIEHDGPATLHRLTVRAVTSVRGRAAQGAVPEGVVR